MSKKWEFKDKWEDGKVGQPPISIVDAIADAAVRYSSSEDRLTPIVLPHDITHLKKNAMSKPFHWLANGLIRFPQNDRIYISTFDAEKNARVKCKLPSPFPTSSLSLHPIDLLSAPLVEMWYLLQSNKSRASALRWDGSKVEYSYRWSGEFVAPCVQGTEAEWTLCNMISLNNHCPFKQKMLFRDTEQH